jgi:hypothetical protein
MTTINATSAEWSALDLDALDYLDGAEFRNETDSGNGDSEGDWFYPVGMIPTGEYIIIFGTHGNDHSPGASHYTYASVYEPNEIPEYNTEVARWEAIPEDLDVEDDGEPTEDEPEEPTEDDYTTTDHQHFYQYGKLVLTVSEDEDHVAALLAHMEEHQFFPGAWFLSDHGNAHPMDLARKES